MSDPTSDNMDDATRERLKRQEVRRSPSRSLIAPVLIAAVAVGIVAACPSPAPAPAPADPAPAPAPAPEPVPAVEPEPAAPTPAPADPAPAYNLEGLWVGSTSSMRSFKLTALGQSGPDFEGTAELQLKDGSFETLAVKGRIDSEGAYSFEGGPLRCQGTVLRRKLTGTCTFRGEKFSITAYGAR